jgi:hypothetical protein
MGLFKNKTAASLGSLRERDDSVKPSLPIREYVHDYILIMLTLKKR